MASAELLAKRDELKQQLSNGDYTTLLQVILDSTGRFVTKITRHQTPPPFWASAFVIALGVLLASWFTSLLLGEFDRSSGLFPRLLSRISGFFAELPWGYRSDTFYQIRHDRIPSEIALVILTFLGTIILKLHLDATCAIWHTKLIDAVERIEDIIDIQAWFSAVCNKRVQLVFGLMVGLLFSIYAVVFVSSARGGFIGVGPVLLDLLVNVQVFLGLYYVFWFVLLPLRIRNYHFVLFAVNPRQSEVIGQLSHMLFNFVYGIAAFVAAITLALSLVAVMNWVNTLILIALGWIPIIAAFMLNQYTLSSIIGRAKWLMLNQIQEKIEMLHAGRIVSEKEVMEETNRLMDLHERIWASRNSVTDIESVISFTNALLLPLISLILGNLPTLLEFFFG